MKVDVYLHHAVQPQDVRSRLSRALEAVGRKVAAGGKAQLVDVFDNLRFGVVEVDSVAARDWMDALAELGEVDRVCESVQSSSEAPELIRPTRVGRMPSDDDEGESQGQA